MKRFSTIVVLLLTLLFVTCAPASADAISALAIEVNPEHLEKTASYARILGYNEDGNTLTVELIAPERFSGEEVAALKEGDRIYTNGQEVLVESISSDDDWCSTIFINDDAIILVQDRDGNYTMMADENDCVWSVIATIECPVKDSLLFLDYVEEETGNALELPVIYTAQELTQRLLTEDASEIYTVGLSANNVYVVFDGEGNLATIQRYAVPWQ